MLAELQVGVFLLCSKRNKEDYMLDPMIDWNDATAKTASPLQKNASLNAKIIIK